VEILKSRIVKSGILKLGAGGGREGRRDFRLSIFRFHDLWREDLGSVERRSGRGAKS